MEVSQHEIIPVDGDDSAIFVEVERIPDEIEGDIVWEGRRVLDVFVDLAVVISQQRGDTRSGARRLIKQQGVKIGRPGSKFADLKVAQSNRLHRDDLPCLVIVGRMMRPEKDVFVVPKF